MTTNFNTTGTLPQEPRPALVSLSAFCQAISSERLSAYSVEATDLDSTDALSRYLWNGALCSAFHPSLHALEIALRNNIFRESQKIVSLSGRTVGSFGCWLDVKPTYLFQNEQASVDEARSRINVNPRLHTPGRLIAKLGFGFWTALCRSPYDHSRLDGPKLWPQLLPRVFPYLPKHERQRPTIQTRLDGIREFRNRIAHHEPVWDRKPVNHYNDILSALSWMYPGLSKAVRVCGNVEELYQGGPQQFRPLAARILGALE